MPRRVLSVEPSGLLSKTFTFRAKDDGNVDVAVMVLHFFSPASIKILESHTEYQVHDESFSSHSWKLVEQTAEKKELISVRVHNLLEYRAVFDMGGESFKLYSPPIGSREWILRNSEQVDVGMVRSDSWSSNTYTVSFDQNVPVQLQVFCYWLVEYLRRQV